VQIGTLPHSSIAAHINDLTLVKQYICISRVEIRSVRANNEFIRLFSVEQSMQNPAAFQEMLKRTQQQQVAKAVQGTGTVAIQQIQVTKAQVG